jgi:hypothetical protein
MRKSYGYTTQEGANDAIETARRVVTFMDAAELRPSKALVRVFGRHCYPAGCGFDHTLVWNAHGSGYVVTTEPYEGNRFKPPTGWSYFEAREWSMWNPPSTVLYVCSPPKHGADLAPIAAKLGITLP